MDTDFKKSLCFRPTRKVLDSSMYNIGYMASRHLILDFYVIQWNNHNRSRDPSSTLKAKIELLRYVLSVVAKFEGVLVNHWKIMAVFRFYANLAVSHA